MKHNTFAELTQKFFLKFQTIFSQTSSAMNFLFLTIISALIVSAANNTNGATFTVTNTNDSGAGSLRQAIINANSNNQTDIINFDIPISDSNCFSGGCTIRLTSSELVITSSDLLIIDASGNTNQIVISGENQRRVFNVNGGASLTLNTIAIRNGNALGTIGGGILNNGTLNILNCLISNNSAQSSGGGVFNLSGTLNITNSIINNNTAGGNGGGVTSTGSGSVNITDSTISNNTGQAHGGGVTQLSGSFNIKNSTISSNTTQQTGGGISNFSGSFNLTNSTVSGNTAQLDGGGIRNDGILNITNVTISNNASQGTGGGIINFYSNPGTVFIRNSIFANNTATNGEPDINHGNNDQFSSLGNNLIGNANETGIAINWQASDILNQPANLAPLGNYGGLTQTHALLSNSLAIDAGNNCVLDSSCPSNNPPSNLTTDQRGIMRPFNTTVDIGAYELGGGDNMPYTPTGNNVTVQPPSGDVSVTFPQVTTAGTTNFAPINPPSSAGSPPSGYTILEDAPAYDITTTASYTPPVIVCFTVNSINDAQTFSRLRILHGENGQLVDRTILPPDSPAPDFGTRRVCARVNSLSPFVVALAQAPTSIECDVAPRNNGNGSVNPGDITQIQRFAVGLDLPFQSNEFQRADCAPRLAQDGTTLLLGNGAINTGDVTQAQRYAVGLDGTPPVAGGPTSGGGAKSERFYETKKAGSDFLFNRNSIFSSDSSAAVQATYEVRAVRESLTATTLTVAIRLDTDASASTQAASVGGTLRFDQTKLSNPTNIRLGSDAPPGTSFFANDSDAVNGRLGFTINAPVNQTFGTGQRQLLLIDFTLIGTGSTELSFDSSQAQRFVGDVQGNELPNVEFPPTEISLSPTAAAVSVSGRVFSPRGRGIARAIVKLTDQQGNIRRTITNTFGFYRFADVEVGQTIVLSIEGKWFYRFGKPIQVVFVNEDLSEVNFIASP